jgi:hypothetical protein
MTAAVSREILSPEEKLPSSKVKCINFSCWKRLLSSDALELDKKSHIWEEQCSILKRIYIKSLHDYLILSPECAGVLTSQTQSHDYHELFWSWGMIFERYGLHECVVHQVRWPWSMEYMQHDAHDVLCSWCMGNMRYDAHEEWCLHEVLYCSIRRRPGLLMSSS